MQRTTSELIPGTDRHTSGLRVMMLGPFECWRGNEPIQRASWRTRPTLELLKFLLDERDRAAPVERLADTIWPSSKSASARQSLQVAIRTLRLALEPNLGRGSDSRYIKTDPGAYRFDSSEAVVDVDLFQAAAQRALSPGRGRQLSDTITVCEEAVALYRGEFLSDDPFSEWAFSTRERLRSRYLDVLDRLSSAQSEAGQWERAIETIETALDLDPYREDLYRRLMSCHMARSRRSHALIVFKRCQTVLKQELGIEPTDETIDLYQEFVEQPFAPSSERQRSIPRAAGNDLRFPFVGRGQEIQALEQAMERARAEQGTFASISGGPGAGKTRLVQEFSRRIELETPAEPAADGRVLWISCHEAERGVPFLPVARLIASLLERSPSTADRRRLAVFAPSLRRLVPQAKSLMEVDESSVAPVEMSQLLEALTQTIRLAFRTGTGVIVIDDLHWADTNTIRWLSYALTRLGPGILTVATYRATEHSVPELRQLFDDARRTGRWLDIHLSGLNTGDLDDLLASGVRDPYRRQTLGQQLVESTGGQPLFVIEILRGLHSDGRIVIDGQGWWRFDEAGDIDLGRLTRPGREFHEIVQSRVERIGAAELDIFRTICVIASECRAPLIAEATGVSIESALALLDTLMEQGLVRVPEGGRGYVAEHPVVQEVVYEELGPARRQERHLAVARAMQQLGDSYPSTPGQTLRHLIAGDSPIPEIIKVAEMAGDQALRQSAVVDAINYYEIAIRHNEQFGSGQVGELLQLTLAEKRADSLAAAGRWDEAIGEYERLQHLGDVLFRSRSKRKLGGVLGDVRGDFDRSLQLLDAAERELDVGRPVQVRQAHDVEMGRIEAARAIVCFFRSDYDQAVTHGERALELWAGKSGLDRDEIELISRIGNALQRLGRLDEAEQRFRTASARASVQGDPALEARLRDSLGGLLFVRGQIHQALAIHQETASVGERLGIPRLELAGLANSGNAMTFLGYLDAARALYERAIERAEALDARYTVMHVLVGLGETLIRLGALEDARAVLKRGISIADEIKSAQRKAHAYLHLAEIALLEEAPDDALEWLELGLDIGREIGDIHSQREGMPLLAQAYLRLGSLDAAKTSALEGLSVATEGGFRVSEARNRIALAEVMLQSADDCASDQLARSEAILREAGVVYDLSRALLLRASISDDQDRVACLAEARQLAADCPAPLLLTAIDRAMNR